MQIPRFWAQVSDTVQGQDGKPLDLKCWGWSTDDIHEARTRASEAFERLLARVRSGSGMESRYSYGNRPLREEIIREVSADGSPSAIISRNSYGALILNTARVMFIDVDVPQEPPPPKGLFGLFRGKKADKPDPAETVLQNLRRELEGYGSFRVYRTAAGYRVLATDPLFEPANADVEQLMERVGADPAFVKLCRAQRSFRARLTPKPWRCNQPRPPVVFPRQDPQSQNQFQSWLNEYDSACFSWSTCRFVEEIGPGNVHEEARPLLDLHDEYTKPDSSLPLA